MNYTDRRNRLLENMEDDSLLILFSGVSPHASADAYYDFRVNRFFYYLTGLTRENMILVMRKGGNRTETALYIEPTDPHTERWTGKMVKADEATEISGITDIRYVDRFERTVNMMIGSMGVKTLYMDLTLHAPDDMPDYNLIKANALRAKYPGVVLRDFCPIVTAMRMVKDEDELVLMSKAIECTDAGLKNVLRNLTPGQYEYQAQADFEYTLMRMGAEGTSFPTIAGSGMNGTMMHYETNRDECKDGTLLLLDLGCRWQGYCSDITRTYPVNGKFTERQKAVYDIVLAANRKVAAEAKPGMTTRDLNDICKKVLAEGCMKLGLIKDESEIGKYYMHSVSHHLGIDVHDVTVPGSVLTPGCVITDEPGLYIDEWEIGIRIEDDLLITEDGCVCMSEGIMRTTDEIEAFMKK